MYYTVIKHSGHLRTLEKCTKHSPAARVCYTSLVFSNARRVLSQCNTQLRLLYLLNIYIYIYIYIYYTTQAVRGPITKISQSKCSIVGPIFSKYWTGHCPERSRTCVPLNLKLRWRTRTKSFENFVAKLQNGWLTLRNPVSALNLKFSKARRMMVNQLLRWKHRVRAR